MSSLRARIAAVLVLAIVLVVCLATVAAMLFTRHQGRTHFFGPTARQLEYLADRIGSGSPPAGTLLRPAPMPGPEIVQQAEHLRQSLARHNRPWNVTVTKPPGERGPFASVEVEPGRWLSLPVPNDGPPPDAWLVLCGWMGLILVGTAAISLTIAHRLTRPLVLLETLASNIEAGGTLGPISEDGPAEIRVTARALNRLGTNLRQAMESRMRLVAAAGHDLRTPLTRMRLRAEFSSEVERTKWLHDIDELERIAESAIALVREEIGSAGDESIQLDSLVRAIVDDLQALNLQIAVGTTTTVSIKGASLALTRAFRNLLINAATHGTRAELSVGTQDGLAVLTIRDHGPGIPDAMMERVFEPFFRADQSRRRIVPGAGLGLAIAREIIGRAHGELVLENHPQGGLLQTASFPIAA